MARKEGAPPKRKKIERDVRPDPIEASIDFQQSAPRTTIPGLEDMPWDTTPKESDLSAPEAGSGGPTGRELTARMVDRAPIKRTSYPKIVIDGQKIQIFPDEDLTFPE